MSPPDPPGDPGDAGHARPSVPGEGEREAERPPAAAEPPSAAPRPPGDDGAAVQDDDPDRVLLHADRPVPGLDELRAAMEWAFRGEEIAPEVLERFAAHAQLVLEGNRRMNLTAVVDPREVAAKHFLDSWRATRLLPLAGRRLLDLGSGAGFPGLPVALAEPQARVVLADSMKKRADFLQECIAALSVKNAGATHERAEDHLVRNRYDLVLVRALSSVRENVRLLRKVKHSLKDFVMLKGPAWSREARAAEREAERLGFRLDTVWEHELPEGLGKRAILVYRAPGAQGQ